MNQAQQTNKKEHKFRLNDLHDIAFGPKFYLWDILIKVLKNGRGHGSVT
jgi:hypothetical protein